MEEDETRMTAKKIETRDLVMTALCTAIIAVCAQITVPLPGGVPMTLHTFAVALCGFLLAPKFAALSMTVYLMLGAVGVPVFSSFRGGLPVLFDKTGGFLIGFLFMAVLASLSKKRLPALGLAMLGLAVCHLCGILQYMLLMHLGFVETALLISLKFIPKDAVSVVLALVLADRLRPMLKLETRQ